MLSELQNLKNQKIISWFFIYYSKAIWIYYDGKKYKSMSFKVKIKACNYSINFNEIEGNYQNPIIHFFQSFEYNSWLDF